MSKVSRSVAMTEEVSASASTHLLRDDGQEDLCFALWYPSQGQERMTALIQKIIYPEQGERNVHGNVSFEPSFFERALALAAAEGAGLALMHSHPLGQGWQLMSRDDVAAEQAISGAVFGATDLPFVGLTLAGDGTWSARFWERVKPHTYDRNWCGSIRIIGEGFNVSFFDKLAPKPKFNGAQVRTVSAWGEEKQADIARLRVGVVGAGSVAGFVADTLARTGFEDVMVIDFDDIEEINLDRLNYATKFNIGKAKVDILADYIRKGATSDSFFVEPIKGAIYESEVFRRALDCDILFSCVDRPWGRHVLNFVAYAHLIPVFDGGIRVRTNKFGNLAAADWRAHTASAGRQCLQCVGQYDPGLVQLERDGYLDDPKYIEGLPEGHPLKFRQNVFAFSMACASQQVLQMLTMVISPLDQPNLGTQLYHFVGGFMEPPKNDPCHTECLFPSLVAKGDNTGFSFTGVRKRGA